MFRPDQFVDPRNLVDKRRGLEKKKSPEFYADKLTEMMRKISERVNSETSEQYGLENFLNSDGSLNMAGYGGDLYTAEQVREDDARIHDMEMEFSRAKVPQVREFYREKYGAKTPDEIVKNWRKEKIKNKNGQMEMAVTGLLHKILKDDFLVVRASAFDDYKNGVDNIILNKRTGEAICAFDEVHEGGAGERTGEKIDKIKKVAIKGGARVRYGIKLEGKNLKRAEMTTLPVFYLGLKSAELENLLGKMDFNPDGAVTNAEYEVFAKLTASLKEQKQILDGTDVPPAVRNRLETFGYLLENFEERSEMRAAA
jgi:hypothetical protein